MRRVRVHSKFAVAVVAAVAAVIVVSPLGEAAGLPAQWVKRAPASSPPARADAGIAFDAARGQTVMFGGDPSLTDTELWDGTNWVRAAPTTIPTARVGPTMVYDAAHQKVVMFGGWTGGLLADTWSWDGTNWTQLAPAASPPARYNATATYDGARGQIVLFGGYGMSGTLNDTWTWDGTTWTLQQPAHSPGPRVNSAMAYDAAHSLTILFSGSSTLGFAATNDTWAWNGSDWTQRSPATSPPARIGHRMVFDPAIRRVVMVGGNVFAGPSGIVNDTWFWNGATWDRKRNPKGFPGRTLTNLTLDVSGVVMFGGYALPTTNPAYDTWTLRIGLTH